MPMHRAIALSLLLSLLLSYMYILSVYLDRGGCKL